MRQKMHFGLCFTALLSFWPCIMLIAGCSGNKPGQEYRLRTDMVDQQSFKHNEDPRPPGPGTVQEQGYEQLVLDSSAAALVSNPFTFTRESADTARTLFETYCFPCHGIAARGDGPVAGKFQTPPDLTSERYRRVSDAYIYRVMRAGIRIMPPYDEETSRRERWLIVSHLRSLQSR